MNGPSTDDETRTVSGEPLDRPAAERPVHIPRPRGDSARPTTPLPPWQPTAAPGRAVSSDDDLLERTLTFSGSYVSDDGNVTIRRSAPGPGEYTGNRFLGYCRRCAHTRLIPAAGEPLPDVPAAVRFAATHDHGEVD
jgi:hypothetical protein